MPLRRPRAEAGGEAVEEGAGERDFRQQDQRLLAPAQRLGDRLEIDLRLARAGDAVQQRDGKALADGLDQRGGGLGLLCRQDRARMVRVRLGGDRARGELDDLERALGEEAVDHAGGDAGRDRQAGFRPGEAVGRELEHAAARPGHPLRRRAGEAHARHRPLRLERLGRAQHHAQHHAARGERVVGEPVDEADERFRQRRGVVDVLDLAQLLARHVVRRPGPDGAKHEPRAERHGDDRAGRQRPVAGVGIGCADRHRHQHGQAIVAHGVESHG